MLYAYFGANNAVPPKGFTLIADNGAYRRILIGRKTVLFGYNTATFAKCLHMLAPTACSLLQHSLLLLRTVVYKNYKIIIAQRLLFVKGFTERKYNRFLFSLL